MFTTITGCSTSGIWFTRRFLSASSPRHMSPMMMTTVDTGRLMLKSERSMALAPQFLAGAASVAAALVGAGRRCGLHELAVLEERAGVADHLVALGEPALEGEVAGARVALAQRERHLLQLAVLHAPGGGLVAVAHEGRGGKREARGGLRLDVALGVEAGEARLLLAR